VIDNIQCEQRFHDYLKEKYTELTIDNIDKKEMYVFTTELLNEFNKFPNFVCSSHLDVEQIKLKQQQEQTKQKELDLKQLELQLRMKEIELQILCINKNDYDVRKNRDANIYKQYLNERTEYSDTHIHTSALYEDFKTWFISNNPKCAIPSSRAFVNNIRQYVSVEKSVKVNKSSTVGVKNLRCINDINDIFD
jgi:hypothetical protein